MPAVANYITFQDKAFELTGGNNIKDWDIKSSGAPGKGDVLGEGILTFMLHVHDADDLKWVVENGSTGPTIATFTLQENYYTTIQEIIDPGQITFGNIRFRRVSGSGKLQISDVVLWFKVNVV